MYKVLLYRSDWPSGSYDTELSRTVWNDELPGSDRIILEPSVKDSITDIPTFEFGILPSHPLYDQITKFKSIITVYRGERVMFYGRVIGDGSDFYGQRAISCEGALSFLIDSWIAPAKSGSVTPKAYLQQLVASHNSQMNDESFKQFTIGNVTATKMKNGTEYLVDDPALSKSFKVDSYTQTKQVIEDNLLGEFKGYVFARFDGSSLYLDWLKSFTRINAQPIKMAVNLLDRTIEENVDDYYTVLLPVGNNNITIASVNDGSIYLENVEAVAKYGRIIKAETFSGCKKASDLLEKAREKLEKHGTNLPISVNVKAVDMYLLGNDTDEIRIGDNLTNLEDRTGQLISDFTVVEATYDLFDPSQDEYVLENQEAIDQRNTDHGDGTLSGRTGGMSRSFGNSRDYVGDFDTYKLTVAEDYSLHARTINEHAETINQHADVINQHSKEHNIVTEVLHAIVDDGYTDSWSDNSISEITLDDGSTAYVQAFAGTRTHQDSSGTVSYSQYLTGVRVEKKPDPDDDTEDFDPSKEYLSGEYVKYEGVRYRFIENHPAGEWVPAQVVESPKYIYTPAYKTDELGNTIYDVITGEAVYATVDDADANSVHIPLRSIARQTRDEFYQVIGTTDITRVLQTPEGSAGAKDFNPETDYAVGDYCYKTDNDGFKILYRFTQHHAPGPWIGTDVISIATQTVQKMSGSTIWQNEDHIIDIVGEVEVTQITPEEAQYATAFAESRNYPAGSYVWYPPTGRGRRLYKFTSYHSAGAWTGEDVTEIPTRTVTIKNGSGLVVEKDGVSLGLYENGTLNAGLLVNSLNVKDKTDYVTGTTFSESKSYSTGDYVTYNGFVYRFTADHPAGPWIGSDAVYSSDKVIKMKADVVDLGDYATVGTLNALTIRVDNLDATRIKINNVTDGGSGGTILEGTYIRTDYLHANDGSVATIDGRTCEYKNVIADNLYLGNSEDGTTKYSSKYVRFGGQPSYAFVLANTTSDYLDIPDAVTHFGTASPSGGTISIPYYTYASGGSTKAGDITFNIADTAYYRSHIGISSTGSWEWDTEAGSGEGGYVRVITPRAGDPETISFPGVSAQATISYNSSTHKYTALAVAKYGGRDVSELDSEPSGLEGYYDGYDTASGQVGLPGAGTSASLIVTYPKTTTSGGTTTRAQSATTYALEASNLTVSVTTGSGDNKVTHATKTCSDANLVASNIKNGVSIFGVTGSYSGGSSGISRMSISNGYSSEPSADYSGSVNGGYWYIVTATPNSGSAKTLKFKTPTASYNYTPSDIRIGNISYYSSLPSGGTTLDTLATSIHANKGKSGYVRIVADLDGYSGTPKYYYIPMSGI